LRSVVREGGEGRRAVGREFFLDMLSWLRDRIQHGNPLRIVYIHVGTWLGILERVPLGWELYRGLHYQYLLAQSLGRVLQSSQVGRVDVCLDIVTQEILKKHNGRFLST
jgi:hypothetical protein